MEFNAQNFGQILKHLREQHGMSMLSLGEKLGTSASRIKSWENGDSVPSAKWILALSHHLEVPADVLLKTKNMEEAYEEQRWEEIMNGVSLQEEVSPSGTNEDYISQINFFMSTLGEQDLYELYTLAKAKAEKNQ